LKKYLLNIHFLDKDRAKRQAKAAKEGGAAGRLIWDRDMKKWFYITGDDDETVPGELAEWYHPVIEDTDRQEKLPEKIIPRAASDDAFYRSVTEIAMMISDAFTTSPEFRNVRVQGEVTSLGQGKGTYTFFSIKDQKSCISCFMFQNAVKEKDFHLENGMKVAIDGQISFYPGNGKTELVVSRIRELGKGDARLRLEQLREELRNLGWFDVRHKKEIPRYPKTFGIVTSKDGKAIKDILKVWREKDPYIKPYLYSCNVQGKDAVRTMQQGIRYLDSMNLDVIILGRGGGSSEDYMTYNERSIVEAVFNAKTPIVSAVGHAGDLTLVDEVSDRSVTTPTMAAEIVIPNVMEEINKVEVLKSMIMRQMNMNLERKKNLLNGQRLRLEANAPGRMALVRRERLNSLNKQLTDNMRMSYEKKRHRFEVLAEQLNGLSPLSKLVRGFGYISTEGKAVDSVDMIRAGDQLDIRLHDGEIRASVTRTRKL